MYGVTDPFFCVIAQGSKEYEAASETKLLITCHERLGGALKFYDREAA